MAITVGTLAKELELFLSHHLSGLDTKARVAGLAEYVRGLGLEGFDKSMLAMARKLDPENIEGCRQRMQRAVAKSKADHTNIFERLQKTIAKEASVVVQALCIDDTSFAKQGYASVGVQRQYSGTLGKVGNCQITTTLHAISNEQSFCVGAQLYLPKS